MKVIAVIVTHNRCELLSRCLDHLQSQTCQPSAVLVINNASTDGTVEMLARRNVPFVTQDNVGSAGGWHRGIEHAMERSFEAVWLMDDDGFPDSRALEVLKEALKSNVACASSIVVREDDPTRFVFPFPILDCSLMPVIWGWSRKLSLLADLQSIANRGTYPFAHLFNGALISLDAVKKVGNVNSDYYIYGDEVDYFFRLRCAGEVISVLNAVHYHPDVSQRSWTTVKVYYYLKNSLTLNARYFNMTWIRHGMLLTSLIKRIITRNGVVFAISLLFGRRAKVFYTAIFRGLQGKIRKDFSG